MAVLGMLITTAISFQLIALYSSDVSLRQYNSQRKLTLTKHRGGGEKRGESIPLGVLLQTTVTAKATPHVSPHLLSLTEEDKP